MNAALWPRARLAEALSALASHARLVEGTPASDAGPPPADGDFEAWLSTAAARLGVETEAVDAERSEASALLLSSAPALVAAGDGFLAVVGAGGGRLVCLAPDGRRVRVALHEARDALCGADEGPAAARADAVLDAAGLAGAARARARRALADRFACAAPARGVFLVRAAQSAPWRTLVREAGLPRLLAALLGAHVLQYVLWIGSWWLLARGALEGRIEAGWLAAWALVLAALAPLRVLETRAAGLLAARGGAVVRRRVLRGALRLEPHEVRGLGVGRLLGETMETDLLEQAGAGGGHLVLTAALDLVGAAAVLAFGARDFLLTAALVAWTVFAWTLARRLLRLRRAWTAGRLDATNDLVERMVGHRTRLVQSAPERRHDGEDAALDATFAASRAMDRAAVRVEALLPRGWLLVGALALAPLFAGGGGADAAFAAAVGGVLLAYSAFRSLASGVERAAAALVAWERVRPLWDAAARPAVAGEPRYAAAGARVGARAIVQASGVVHRPHGRAADVLRGVDLSIGDGDRVLLVGSSGGGKSTLASILAGCRAPSAGLVLQRGLDVSTLGETAWRRGAVLAPQFHENHVLSAPVLFNALMGRAWPPSREDVVACEDVLRGLRLDGVVARMPGGLGQMLGDSGWQLSHGERSRLFIARALLQKADLTLLDESFAALDPATLKETLAFVESRANALVVVAHE